MFVPIQLEAKSSTNRKWINTSLILICAFFIWVSPTIFTFKIILSIFLFGYFVWLLFKERQVLVIDWKLIDDIQIQHKDLKTSYKLSSCIITSWYCVWILTEENGGYKKIHLWFDQFDKQTTWQLRRNLETWKQKSA